MRFTDFFSWQKMKTKCFQYLKTIAHNNVLMFHQTNCPPSKRAEFRVGSVSNILDHLDPGQTTFVSRPGTDKVLSALKLLKLWTIWNIYITQLHYNIGGPPALASK